VALWNNQPGPSAASGLHNLGVLYANSDRLAKAEKCFQDAIRIASASLPPDHPDLATYRLSYAALLRKLDRKGEAKEMEKAAQSSRQRYAQENLLGYTVDARDLKK